MNKIYRKGTQLEYREFNFTCHQGGLGDLIGQLPALLYVLKHHRNIVMNLWVHEYAVELCKKVFENYPMCRVMGMDSKDLYNAKLPARSPYAHAISNLSQHITEHAFITLVGKPGEPEDMNYISLEKTDVSHFNIPKNSVVVTTGYTSNTREWKPESVNEVSDYIISKGFVPVYLGKSYTHAFKGGDGIKGNFEADYTKGINLIDKTTIFEAHSIMANSKCVVGVDNGLCPHLAAMSDVKMVIAFTTLKKEHRLPYRHNVRGWNCYPIEIPELSCSGCQSNMSFADKKHDFRNCFYDDYKCVDMLTSDRFIKELEKIL